MSEILSYIPIRDGYQVELGYSGIEVKLEAGPSRRRRDHLRATHTVSLTWNLTSALDYSRFMSFFRSTLNFGTESFRMLLVTDVGVPMYHLCRCLGTLPKLVQQSGLSFWVGATLEVEPNPTISENMVFVGPTDSIAVSTTQLNNSGIRAGDTISIHHSSASGVETFPSLHFDGEYTVDSVSTGQITLTTPASVNASWTTLGASSTSRITSVIVKLPA